MALTEANKRECKILNLVNCYNGGTVVSESCFLLLQHPKRIPEQTAQLQVGRGRKCTEDGRDSCQ